MTYTTAITATSSAKTVSTVEQQRSLSTTAISRVRRQSVAQQALSFDSTSDNRLQAALEHARRLTQMYGYQGVDVAIAWETVEELRTSRRARLISSVSSCQTLFEQYCTDNPYALECRSYDC